jgi:hypothetical protein
MSNAAALSTQIYRVKYRYRLYIYYVKINIASNKQQKQKQLFYHYKCNASDRESNEEIRNKQQSLIHYGLSKRREANVCSHANHHPR